MKQVNGKRKTIDEGFYKWPPWLRSTWHLVSDIAYQQHLCPVIGVSYRYQ